MHEGLHTEVRPGEATLFVHLRWETRDGAPLLAYEDVAQAAYTAVAARAKCFRCRTLAVGGTGDHLHAVFRFPASVPISVLASQVMEVSGQAVARILRVIYARPVAADAVWNSAYGLQTLGAVQVDDVARYVLAQQSCHRRGETRSELETVQTQARLCLRPPWSEAIREAGASYAGGKED